MRGCAGRSLLVLLSGAGARRCRGRCSSGRLQEPEERTAPARTLCRRYLYNLIPAKLADAKGKGTIAIRFPIISFVSDKSPLMEVPPTPIAFPGSFS